MNALFHIPGPTAHYKMNTAFIRLINEHHELFVDEAEISSVYGTFPPALWNGGRAVRGQSMPLNEVERIIDEYNSLGVMVRFTFTNPLLTEEHLDDDFCNGICKIAEKKNCEIIIFSPLLESYLRKNYPGFTYTSSTCKQIEDPDELKKELDRDYRLVVLDYNWNNKFDFLETLPHKEKCEFLLNAICISHCPQRGYHYRYLGQQQIINNEVAPFIEDFGVGANIVPQGMKPFKCPFNTSLENGMNQETYISRDSVYNKYLPMGFSNFKIEGRTYKGSDVLNEYIKYMAKEGCEEEIRSRLIEFVNDKEIRSAE